MNPLAQKLEAILFTSSHVQSLSSLAEGLGVMQSEVDQALRELAASYRNRGVKLIRKGNEVVLGTDPALTEVISRFYQRESRSPLTRAGLETLAIVMHREPVTRSQIEEIRGVSSERILRTLLIRGLIREAGRAETLGRPILYATTVEFLRHFGVERPEELPEPPETTLFAKSDELAQSSLDEV